MMAVVTNVFLVVVSGLLFYIAYRLERLERYHLLVVPADTLELMQKRAAAAPPPKAPETQTLLLMRGGVTEHEVSIHVQPGVAPPHVHEYGGKTYMLRGRKPDGRWEYHRA